MVWLTATKKVTAYIASGFFNEEQIRDRATILEVLKKHEVSYFNPQDEVLVGPNSSQEEQKKAFEADVTNVATCDFIIASTTGKDTGTLFECGVAYTNKVPIIYYFNAPKHVSFNLMLAQSAYAVAHCLEELDQIVADLKNNNFVFDKPIAYKGCIE